MAETPIAVIFDLDGVIVDTVELHYHGWSRIAAELGLPFDRDANDRLRGLSRTDSLERLLGARTSEFTPAQKAELIARKNDDLLSRVAELTSEDMISGARGLLLALRTRKISLGLASSSRNARVILEQLDALHFFKVVVDGNTVPLSKPDPAVYLAAAEQLGFVPHNCVAIEDGEAGVAAAKAAEMRVIGVGRRDLVAGADWHTPSLAELSVERILAVAGN